jgi:hypothetical protein
VTVAFFKVSLLSRLKPDPGRIPESAADGTAYQPSGGNLTYEDVVNAGLFLIVFLKALPNLKQNWE